ncbi:MAG: AAA family ATPase [Chloroflexi bacterium]|nr:AAA family ATPase [Chloroflexota bacterium]
MPRLSLAFFGGFDVALDGQPVAGLKSDKIRALLAYLAVEANRPHRRETLAGLLWPDSPNTAALNSLRNALANLRQALGDAHAAPPFFLIARAAIRFNPAANCWLDVAEFEERIANGEWPLRVTNDGSREAAARNRQSAISNRQSAISLYRGPFLAGFSVNSAPFEEWALYKREQFQQQASLALHRLTIHHAERGEHGLAQDYARQRLLLEPYDEEAHRQLMRSLAAAGQRNAALAQYEVCRRLLAAELGVEPVQETTALCEAIRDGAFDKVTRWEGDKVTASSPLTVSPCHPVSASPPFVARESELAKLNDHLKAAFAGQGRVVFVTGDAGSGKTALVQEFARQAMAAHGDLLAVTGNCNAQVGMGDPYLPFVEILQLLTGDIEAKRAGGVVTLEHARRLWSALPQVLEALVTAGPDLIGRFVPGAALRLRAEACSSSHLPSHGEASHWRLQLAALGGPAAPTTGDSSTHQPQMRLLDQVTAVLATLARWHPLLLILDDLQWADAGSISLLFHLGRRLAGSRILVVGAYRPEPLASVISIFNELTRLSGDICVDLTQADGRRFLDAFLDREPNCLDTAFRDTLYRHTGGHALFTGELLRGMQERGDLVRDREGRWAAGLSLDWERLPARVEAVIAERISRISHECRTMLAVASVEGEEFTAEVLARVLGVDESALIQQLSGPLCKQHQLIHAQSLRRLDASGQRLSGYRFQHDLFQKYFYYSLDDIERSRLHEAVGAALETLYGGSAAEIEALSPRLAWHFEAAGLTDKAVGYLLQAGRRATRLAASEEALGHFTHGLALLRALPESVERTRREIELQTALGASLVVARGWGTPERATAFARALELSQRVGELTGILQTMLLQADQCRAAGECARARTLGEQMLLLAQQTEKPLHLALAHYTVGASLAFCGDLVPARSHLEQGVALCDPQSTSSLTTIFGADLGVTGLSWLAWVLWDLGYPEQAFRRSQEALARATELAHPFSVGLALTVACLPLAVFRSDDRAVRAHLAALAKISEGQENALFRIWHTIYSGWLQARQGETVAGIAALRRGMAAWEASGSRSGRPLQLLLLAETYLRSGQIAQGSAVIAAGLALIEETGARMFEAESHRLAGALLELQPAADAAAPEVCYQRALAVARRQAAKLWELRACVSLFRLQRQPEGRAKARQMLSDICDWFVEGADLLDLVEARQLLLQSPFPNAISDGDAPPIASQALPLTDVC